MDIVVKLSLDLPLWEYTLHFYEDAQKTKESTFKVPRQGERDLLLSDCKGFYVEFDDVIIEVPKEIFTLMESEISKDPLVMEVRQIYGRACA